MKPIGTNAAMRAFLEREKLRELRCRRINEELQHVEDKTRLRFLNRLWAKIHFGLLDDRRRREQRSAA